MKTATIAVIKYINAIYTKKNMSQMFFKNYIFIYKYVLVNNDTVLASGKYSSLTKTGMTNHFWPAH